jgi:hypothetical protein
MAFEFPLEIHFRPFNLLFLSLLVFVRSCVEILGGHCRYLICSDGIGRQQ